MGSVTTGNIITADATDTTLWSGTKFVREIQWLSDADDIVDTDEIIITSSGGTITVTIPDLAAVDCAAVLPDPVKWKLGPFDGRGIPMANVGVTIDNGLVVFVVG